MPACHECQHLNTEDARYCAQCGASVHETTAGEATEPSTVDTTEAASEQQADAPLSDQELWRQFIGPNADRYLDQFKKFSANGQPRFALTWNWPAFLYISFLWFLYRKMYMHAFVYAIGPMLSSYLTGDLTVGVVWSIMAGATANYLYYWHCKEGVEEIKKAGRLSPAARNEAIKEAGGVQPYVIYVGIALYVLAVASLVKMVQDGPPEGTPVPTAPSKSASVVSI